jgi:hypothetical protein
MLARRETFAPSCANFAEPERGSYVVAAGLVDLVILEESLAAENSVGW